MMRLAAQIEPGSTEERKAFMEGAINIRKMKGVESDKEAMALIHEVVEAGGIIEPAAMVKQFSIAMAGAKGATAVQAGGLIAALSQAAGDRTGRGAGEAMGKIVTGLEELLPEKDRAIYKEGRQVGRRKGTGLADFDQRIAYIRSLPQAKQDALLSQLGLEGKFAEGFRQVITGAPGVAGETYRKFTAEAPGFTGEWDKGIALTNQPFTQKFGQGDRGLNSLGEGLDNTPVGRGAAIAGLFSFPKLKETMGISGQYGVESILTDLQQKAQWYSQPGQNPEEFIKLLEQRARSMQGVGWVQRKMALSGQPFPGVPESGQESMRQRVLERPMSQQELDLGATSEVFLKMIPEVKTLFQDLIEENKRTNTLLEKAQATPAPAAVQENRNQHGPAQAYGFWHTFGFGTPAH